MLLRARQIIAPLAIMVMSVTSVVASAYDHVAGDGLSFFGGVLVAATIMTVLSAASALGAMRGVPSRR